MEFWLPLREGFRAVELLDWGRRHLASDWCLPLPDGLPERGFLNGFIDLVCRHEGRFWLFDWKTNFLGNACGDYHPAALAADMAHHHYRLQYHLYLVALDRYLRRRLPDYDYERHCGGVYYLYLRGLNGRDAATGVYADRPCREAIRELEEIICGV
jgi:exodeoxyribonuclease V beta subunit